jgi:DNA-binding MarR family transcriptional regulator
MSPLAEPITDLIVETFRLNGALLAAGDKLVADLHLTSARWQVLGAMGMSIQALPVAQIARNMGLSRQAVQRVVNELATQGLVRFAANPHHQRAKLVLMTGKGRTVFEAAMKRQSPWANALADGLSTMDVEITSRVLRAIRDKLLAQNDLQPTERDNVEEFA